MSVQSVSANISGQNYNLTYNGTSNKWEATITASSMSSYNNNAGHYYPATITATDDASNITTVDDTDPTLGDSLKLYVKEKVKPTITAVSPTAGAKLTTATPTISFQLRDEVNGSGVKIDTLALKIDGGSAIGNAATGMTVNSVTNGYDCSYVAQSALSEGSHTYTIDIQDNDGNAANTLSVTISIDVTSPSLTVTNPTEGLITNNNSLTVSGTTNDATSTPVTIAITLNGTDQGAVTVSSGSFSKSVTLASGSNTIVVTATDASGLTTTVTRHVTLDTGAPVITSVELIPNPVDAGQTFILKVTVTD